MTGYRTWAAAMTALACVAGACESRAGGIGSAMYYGPYTGGHPYSYAEAYGYALPFTSVGFSGPWTYPYDWGSYPYRGLAFPARGTHGWPKVVPDGDGPDCAGPVGPPLPATISIEVLPDAELWFDGNKTQQTGATRNFQSPPLDGGKTYHYVVRALDR